MSPIYTTFELCIIVAVQFQLMLQLIVIDHFMKEYMLLLLKNENKCRKNYTHTVTKLHSIFSWQNFPNWPTIKRRVKQFKGRVSVIDIKPLHAF